VDTPIDPTDDDAAPTTLRKQYDAALAFAGRSKTLSRAAMVRQLRDLERAGLKEDGNIERPVTRADCKQGVRPCPFVGCKYHLYLDVASNGSLKINFPQREPEDLEKSCALDIAEHGGITLDATGFAMNLTRERVRQVESRALLKLQDAATMLDRDRRRLRHLPIIDSDTADLFDELDESA
jgi:Sigma-70, region 4